MFREEDAKQLYDNKFFDEVTVLSSFQVFFAHEVHELSNKFRHEQVERRVDEGHHYCHNYLSHVREQKVKEKLVLLLGVI